MKGKDSKSIVSSAQINVVSHFCRRLSSSATWLAFQLVHYQVSYRFITLPARCSHKMRSWDSKNI